MRSTVAISEPFIGDKKKAAPDHRSNGNDNDNNNNNKKSYILL